MVESKSYSEWFKMAQRDLESARILFEHDADFSTVCFHLQQAVEKYTKGFLLSKTGLIQEGHNLVKLCRKAAAVEHDCNQFLKDAAFLNTFYIETRYPAEDPLIVEREDVMECFRITDKVLGFIDGRLTQTK